MAEQSIGNSSMVKCAHNACTCTAKSGEQYCSDYCARADKTQSAQAQAGSQGAGKCNCGHPGCK